MMKIKDEVLKKIDDIPEKYLYDILSYIRNLELKIETEKLGISIASEGVLKKEWLSPEEDEAWKNL